MTAMRRQWPDAECDLLVKMWTEGKSAGQIARAIPGRTRNAVIGKVHRMGMARSEDTVREERRLRAAKPPREPRIKLTVLRVIKTPPPPPSPPPVVSTLHARPWMSRASRECAWLLDDGRSCCAAVTRGSYCAGHAAQVYRPVKKLAVEKMARKFG